MANPGRTRHGLAATKRNHPLPPLPPRGGGLGWGGGEEKLNTERKVWRNGKMIPWEKATVHLMSHSLTRGSAIFEVLAVYSTPRGPAAFRLPEHVDRLFRSAELLGMQLGQSKKEILRAVVKTVKVNRIREWYVNIVGSLSQETFFVSMPDPRLD